MGRAGATLLPLGRFPGGDSCGAIETCRGAACRAICWTLCSSLTVRAHMLISHTCFFGFRKCIAVPLLIWEYGFRFSELTDWLRPAATTFIRAPSPSARRLCHRTPLFNKLALAVPWQCAVPRPCLARDDVDPVLKTTSRLRILRTVCKKTMDAFN